MSNSAIYTVNTAKLVLPAGSRIPVGKVIRRFGKNLKAEDDGIVLCGSGYFTTSVIANLLAASIGPIGIQLLLDDEPYSGASAKTSSCFYDAPVNLIIAEPLIRVCGNDCSRMLTVIVDAQCQLDSLAVKVEKI